MKLNEFLLDAAALITSRFSSAMLTSICLSACVAAGAQSTEASQSFDPIQLQREFASATDLQLLHQVAAIPEDVRVLLAAIDGATPLPADLGMDWSYSDSHLAGLPTSQHLFSAANDRLAIILFAVGGPTVQYQALLARRNSRQFCLFDLGAFGTENLRLSALQFELNPNKHPASPRAPECIRRFAN